LDPARVRIPGGQELLQRLHEIPLGDHGVQIEEQFRHVQIIDEEAFELVLIRDATDRHADGEQTDGEVHASGERAIQCGEQLLQIGEIVRKRHERASSTRFQRKAGEDPPQQLLFVRHGRKTVLHVRDEQKTRRAHPFDRSDAHPHQIVRRHVRNVRHIQAKNTLPLHSLPPDPVDEGLQGILRADDGTEEECNIRGEHNGSGEVSFHPCLRNGFPCNDPHSGGQTAQCNHRQARRATVKTAVDDLHPSTGPSRKPDQRHHLQNVEHAVMSIQIIHAQKDEALRAPQCRDDHWHLPEHAGE